MARDSPDISFEQVAVGGGGSSHSDPWNIESYFVLGIKNSI